MPRILHVISSLDAVRGGPTLAVAGMAQAQQAAGLKIDLVYTYSQTATSTETADAVRQHGIAVTRIGPTKDPLSRHPDIKPKLAELISAADVVHVHCLWEDIQHHACRTAYRLGKPCVITPHGMLDPWSLSQGYWKKRIYLALRMRRNLNRAAIIHYTTQTEMDLTAPLNLQARGLIEPNGIEIAEFQDLPVVGTFHGQHPELQGRPYVISLGRLHPKKGFDLLIPAFAALPSRDHVLVIAGPDSDGYQAEIEKMIDRHQVRDRVILVGMLRGRDRIEALRDATLYALPSYQENFGIAVVEALATATPVVISDQVNIHKEITAANVGGVVPTQVAPLVDALANWLKLAADPQVRQRARDYAMNTFDWNQIARHWVKHYEALLH